MANYTNHKNNKPLPQDVRDEIARRMSNGEAKTQIAKALGISHAVVRKYTLPLPHFISNAVKEEALRLLDQGFTRSEIARSLGVCRQWVGSLRPSDHKVPNRISEETKQELMRRVLQGEPVAYVARELKINQTYAYTIVSARVDEPTTEQVEEIKKRLAENQLHNEIAAELTLPLRAIKQVAGHQSSGVRYTEAEKLAIAELVSRGLQIKEIALQCGVGVSIVKKAYRECLKAGQVPPRINLAMEDDRELLRIQRLYPQLEEWRGYAVQYYKLVKGNFGIISSAMNSFFEYLVMNNLYERPADFLLRKNANRIPVFFGNARAISDHGAGINNAVADFLDWILIQPEFTDFQNADIPTTLPMFKNPIVRVNRSDHNRRRDSESNKNIMPYWMIHDLRRRIAQGPDFRDWQWAQTLSGRFVAYGNRNVSNWFSVREDQIDKADPDCVWRLRERINRKPVLEMWSPVRWVAILIKLQTTARTGQIRMVDSGEADTFVFENGKFVLNQSDWARGTPRNPRCQGVLRQGDETNLVLYFNTNKTADINKFGPEKGMECPWPQLPEYQDDPYYWLEKLRNWQNKYNPAGAPLAWQDIPCKRRLRGKSEIDCFTYPDTSFLFRTPEVEGEERFPLSYSSLYKCWQIIIAAYEIILAEEGKVNVDGTPIRLLRDGVAWVSPHGLRVSLITHLIMDGNMPPELMMKIVGHSRLIMTIYYTKPGLGRIEDSLLNATKILNETKDATLIRDLQSKSEEEIRDSVVFNAEELVYAIPLNPSDRNPLGWLPMHDGICLAGGNSGPLNGDYLLPGCHNGGPLIDGKYLRAPAPGGVRNCCRCRWKCAGTSHLLGLQATFNNRQFHLYKASEAAIEAERSRNEFLREKARVEAGGVPFSRQTELRTVERIHEAAMQKMQELALDLASINRMIERIAALPENVSGPTALAVQGDILTLQTVVEETDSELLVLSEVCADVEFFPDLDPGTAVFEYAHLLDLAFERDGQPMILSRLTGKEKLIAANAIMRELERRVDPANPTLGRRKVVEIMDRGESLERMLGIKLKSVIQVADPRAGNLMSLRLLNT